MSLRTRSRAGQWGAWTVAALVAVAAYVVLFRVVGEGELGDLIGPLQQRVLLPIVVVFGFVVYETRWNGAAGAKKEQKAEGNEGTVVARSSEATSLPRRNKEEFSSVGRGEDAASTGETGLPVPGFPAQAPAAGPDETGEELYARARGMPHQEIPDFLDDGEYLELLGEAAEKGYPHALAKLGEYALRRCAWVEAYYWMKKARRAGMENLEPVLRGIRLSWATDGYPLQTSNVHRLFSELDGSVGRALVNLDSGRETATARAYLRANRPELLD